MNCPVCCSFTCVCDDGAVFLDRNFEHETMNETQVETITKQCDMLLEALKVNEEHIRNGAELVFGAAKQMILFRCDEMRAIIKQVESER